MNDEFVTYQIAKHLARLGFNKQCFAQYLTDKSVKEGKLYAAEVTCITVDDFDSDGYPLLQTVSNKDFERVPQYVAAPTWNQAVNFLELNYAIAIETVLDDTLMWIYYLTPRGVDCKLDTQKHSMYVYSHRVDAVKAALNEILPIL